MTAPHGKATFPGDLQLAVLADRMFGQNAYVLLHAPSGEAWVIDPGFQADEVLEHLSALGQKADGPPLTLSRILNTHCHVDHIAGNAAIKQAYPTAPLCAPAGELDMLTDAELNLSAGYGVPIVSPPADVPLRPGDTLTLGTTAFVMVDVAGHSPAGLAFVSPTAGLAVVGDALFAGSIGRTDLPGGSRDRLVSNIRGNLYSLPDATIVLPGHGPSTTVRVERATNPYTR